MRDCIQSPAPVTVAGRAVTQAIRDIDIPVQLSAAEFLVVMPHTDVDGASVVAERIRRKAKGANITVSIGVAGVGGASRTATDKFLARAARGLASLLAHDNQFDIAKAKAFQVEWTPRGWMSPHLDLLGFEQQLYLRQPGYGTSYVTGKHLLDELIRVRAHQLGADFSLYRFFDEVNGAGMIPVSMIHWQLTAQETLP